jgi:hypothetical protein
VDKNYKKKQPSESVNPANLGPRGPLWLKAGGLVKLNEQPFEGLVLSVMSEVGEDKEL